MAPHLFRPKHYYAVISCYLISTFHMQIREGGQSVVIHRFRTWVGQMGIGRWGVTGERETRKAHG